MPRRPTPPRYWCGLCSHAVVEHGAHGCKRKPCACPRSEAEARQPVPAPAKNGHPSRSEKFLCSRCPAQFPSRAERDAHQAAHPEIPPAPVLRRAGEGTHAGFGE